MSISPPILRLVTVGRGGRRMELSPNKQKAFDSRVKANSYQGIMVRLITQREMVALDKCTLCLFWSFKRALSGSLRLPNDVVLTRFCCCLRSLLKWP